MEKNVYEAPTAEIEQNQARNISEDQVPEKILKDIKNGSVAAIVSGVITLVFTLIAISSDFAADLSNVLSIYSLIDVVLIFGLAYGVHKKSRIASTLLLAYFVLSKIIIMMETGRASGIVVSLIFLYYYFMAMVATYKYHSLVNAE